MVVFLQFFHKLQKLFLSKDFLLVVELFHKGQQNQFVLGADFARLVNGVVKGADDIGQKVERHSILKMVLEDNCAEDLLLGKFFFVHFGLLIW